MGCTNTVDAGIMIPPPAASTPDVAPSAPPADATAFAATVDVDFVTAGELSNKAGMQPCVTGGRSPSCDASIEVVMVGLGPFVFPLFFSRVCGDNIKKLKGVAGE